MKKTIITISVITFLTLTLFSFKKKINDSDDKRAIGKAMVINGKYIFTNSEPVASYETAFEFITKVHSFGGCPTLKDYAEGSVQSANKKGFPYDAIILGNTKYDLAIRFK